MHKIISKLAVVVLIIAAFLLGAKWGYSRVPAVEKVVGVDNKTSEISSLPDIDFDPFWRVWRVLENKYVPRDISTTTEQTKVSLFTQEMVWGAIEGLTRSLEDPYTTFLPPWENELFQTEISGNFAGVGMEIGMRDGVLTVIAPLRDTPAERAGVLAGDIIIEIDGESTGDVGLDEAVKRIRGEAGTVVVLTVYREEVAEPIEISVVRDNIKLPSGDTYSIGEGREKVFVIELNNFSAPAPEFFRQALIEFHDARTVKLIVDLRNNPGGFLEAAVDMVSWFLPEGKIIVTEYKGEGNSEKVHRSVGYDVFSNDLKLAVLVNEGSASASEIFAGSLRDHGIATVIGEKTFGKGSVQELVNITTETALKVTIARWLLPEGQSISGNGLTPDIVIEMTREDREAERDPILDEALRYLRDL